MDQEKPLASNIPSPAGPTPAETKWASTEISPPPPPPPVAPSTIVVSRENERGGKKFSLLFILVLIGFIVMTVVLVKTVRQKGLSFLPPDYNFQTPTVTTAVVTAVPMLTPTPTKKRDLILEKLEQITATDEVADLEADITNTDFSSFEQMISDLDDQLGFTSLKK